MNAWSISVPRYRSLSKCNFYKKVFGCVAFLTICVTCETNKLNLRLVLIKGTDCRDDWKQSKVCCFKLVIHQLFSFLFTKSTWAGDAWLYQ